MTLPLLIAIEPSDEAKEQVYLDRKKVSELVSLSGIRNQGNVNYESEPHITLFVNSFDSYEAVEEQVEALVKSFQPFTIEAKGIDAFEVDPVWHSSILKYTVLETDYLKNVLVKTVEALNPLRNNDQANWLLHENPHMDETSKKFIDKYGYAFGPENWSFHMTVGSTSLEGFNAIKDFLENNKKTFSWNVDHISVYKHHSPEGFKLHKRYSFG